MYLQTPRHRSYKIFRIYRVLLFLKYDCNKYEIFLMGNFNIDLLQHDTNTISNDFINSMTAHSFLPYILHPTRVTDHSATVIDNIFSNITDSESISGNLTTLISDHIKFIFIKKYHPTYKSCNYYVHELF